MDNKLYFGGIAAGQTSRQPAHATTASDIDFDSMTFGVDKQEIELDMENYSCFCTTFHADHQVCTAELSPLIPEHEHWLGRVLAERQVDVISFANRSAQL